MKRKLQPEGEVRVERDEGAPAQWRGSVGVRRTGEEFRDGRADVRREWELGILVGGEVGGAIIAVHDFRTWLASSRRTSRAVGLAAEKSPPSLR